MRLAVKRRTLRLRRPLHTAYGTVMERELLVVTLTAEDGAVGHGEAAPLEPYDGVSIARVEQALARYQPILEGVDESPGGASTPNGAQIVDACRTADELPQALAAIDMALWDLAGRRTGKPVCALLTDVPAQAVAVNATLSALDRAGAGEEAAKAVADGFECLKVKVGMGDDAARVAAVRAAAGPRVALRVDANGAWDVEQAVRAIDRLAPAGLELVEEPVHGIEATRQVRERVAARVAIDETAAEHGALGAGAADAVCLKVSRCGGISGLLAAATLVRTSGAEVYLASTLDGPLGIAAGLHAAAALASRGPLPPCGLATLGMFEPFAPAPGAGGAGPPGVAEALTPVDGRIAVPQGPGLGVEPV